LTTQGKILGISLGPGDPQLITVKGLSALQRADKIYYPATAGSSYSLSILQHYDIDKSRLHPMLLEMSADRAHNIDTYACTFAKMKADCENGLTVAFVSEGDISFYSTFVHLLRLIRAEGLPVEIIAGVSSFLAACAAHVEPLAVLKERIAVIPLLDNSSELEYHLLNFNTVVLIKVRRAAELVIPFVQAGMAVMLYSEKLGTAEEFISRDPVLVATHEPPYFSLIILKSNLCG
jgi:precorrin-2/cobalt-factor-2 C20-methyltransferase